MEEPIEMQTILLSGEEGTATVKEVYTVGGVEVSKEEAFALQRKRDEDVLDQMREAFEKMEAARLATYTPEQLGQVTEES